MKPLLQALIILCLIHFITTVNKAFISKPPTCGTPNPKYIRSFSIVVNKMHINLDVDLNTSIYSGIFVNMEFLSRKHNSKSYQTFYNYSLDMCHILGSLKINIFKEWISSLRKYGNFAAKCPILENHYYLRDYKSSELKLPSIFFTGSYRMVIKILHIKNKNTIQETLIACAFDMDIK